MKKSFSLLCYKVYYSGDVICTFMTRKAIIPKGDGNMMQFLRFTFDNDIYARE